MIGAAGELDYFSAHIHLREPDKSEDKAEYANVATKEAKENLIGAIPATRWWRPCMRVRESIGRKEAEEVENTEANSKYQDRGGRTEAKKLHKTGIDELLIKIAESKGLRVDAGVLDQGTK
ncbi:hypothetical protein GW17_00008413 [Ensete ventricosum]|nr:hypothetical protein GW17_00008413 [Ensete ventricosum]